MDRFNRPLGCLLLGSSAWKVACRDEFIGWDIETRQRNVNLITNNTRFLVLPWIQVRHLASHILAQVSRRISSDWLKKYGHGIELLETFVERDRFLGTCYKAANWIYVGQTTGRSRNDRYSNIKVPVKDIYIFPLDKNFRHSLTLSVYNIYARENPVFINFNKSMNEGGAFEVPTDLLTASRITSKTFIYRLTPSVGYQFRF